MKRLIIGGAAVVAAAMLFPTPRANAAALTAGYTTGDIGSNLIVDDESGVTGGGNNLQSFDIYQYTGLAAVGKRFRLTALRLVY